MSSHTYQTHYAAFNASHMDTAKTDVDRRLYVLDVDPMNILMIETITFQSSVSTVKVATLHIHETVRSSKLRKK